MVNAPIHIAVGERVAVFACGVVAGERFITRYAAIGDCGVEVCQEDFRPQGTPVYIGGLPQRNVLWLDIPGTYYFAPDGVVSDGAQVLEVAREDIKRRGICV